MKLIFLTFEEVQVLYRAKVVSIVMHQVLSMLYNGSKITNLQMLMFNNMRELRHWPSIAGMSPQSHCGDEEDGCIGLSS